MKIRTTIDNELEKLDLKWRNLPVRTQIRYVLYLFAFYMLLGVGVMIKVFYDLGKDDGMEVRHIGAPSVIKGDPISNKVKNNKNGRERE